MRTQHDVLIVGAGPAGSHLALRLAREGFSVALADRRRFPREKPCGEFMSPECLPLLEDLGLREAVLAAGARRVHGMRLHGHGRAAAGRYADIGAAAARFDHGYAVRREVLDELALRAAERAPGVDVLEGFALDELVRGADGRLGGAVLLDPAGGRRELRARFTVGADGLRSRVASRLGAALPSSAAKRYALVARFTVPAEELAEVHFVPGGYFAAAPVDAHTLTVNLVVGAGALGGGGQAGLERDFRRHVALAPALAEKLGDAPLAGPIRACGPFAAETREQAFDGGALVGDACGFVDPLTGEGLFYAMRGAELLARDLAGALRAGRSGPHALRGYAEARRRELGPRSALARLLQRGLARPAVVRAALALLEARPGLADLLVAVTGDYVPLRELLRPGVWSAALRRPLRTDPPAGTLAA